MSLVAATPAIAAAVSAIGITDKAAVAATVATTRFAGAQHPDEQDNQRQRDHADGQPHIVPHDRRSFGSPLAHAFKDKRA